MVAKFLKPSVMHLLFTALVLGGVPTFACGGGHDGHPDTGAGADAAVPSTINCSDLCSRMGACVVLLCNEDTHSRQFEGAESEIKSDCLSTCSDAQAASNIPVDDWRCLFKSSCRQVLEYGLCHGMPSYSCSRGN